jgi:ADP-ribose pyrophosphatase YjhB (NUDIX family)
MDEQFLEATISIRGVVCRPDETVLTIRRVSDDGWELPGGRIRCRESVPDCLRRELTEETDLDATVHHPVEAVSWQNDAGSDRFAVYYYCTTDAEAVTLSEEHTEWAWVGEGTARERLSDPQATATARAVAANTVATVLRED